MATTRFADHLLTGIHSARPAASAVPAGTLYSCTTHSLIYQSDGTSAWSTYASLGGTETLPVTIIDAKGDLIAGSAADTAAKLTVGSNGQILTADSTQTTGIKWAAAAGGMVADTLWDAKGDLAVGSAADTAARLPVGTNGQVLAADSTQTLGVKWTITGLLPIGTGPPPAGVGTIGDLYLDTTSGKLYQFKTGAPPDWVQFGSVTVGADKIWTAKGDLVAATGSASAVRVPVGSNTQVLTADSTFPSGVKWATPAAATPPVATDTIWDSKGDLAVASAADTAAKLPVGSNNQVLQADSAQTLGVKWADPGSTLAPAAQPRTHKLLGWAYDPSSVTTTLAPTAGQATLIKVFMPDGGTIGKACVVVGVLGGTITNAFLGVYNAAGQLIGKTADQSSAWTTTGFKNPAVTAEAGQSLTVTGGIDVFVWVAILVGAATTIPAFMRGNGTGGFANLGLVAADGYRYGTSGSSLTALTSTVSPTGLGLAVAYWAGVST